MGIVPKWIIRVVLLAFLLVPAAARAAPAGDEVVFGGSYTLASGQTLQGNLLILGGTATIEAGARVTGDITLLGGSLIIDGEVDGNVSATGGSLTLGATAVIYGDLGLFGAGVDQKEGAQILGDITIEEKTTHNRILEDSLAGQLITNILDMLWTIFVWFAFSALAVLLVIFAPNPTSRVAQTLVLQPGMSALMGLLTLVVAIPVLLLLAITILLVPVSFLGLLALGAAVLFGWISLGLETGNRLARAFRQEWASPVAAGLGTFLLTFVTFSLDYLFSWMCIGWIFPTVVGFVGLGAVVLSQFGRMVYQPPNSISVTTRSE